MVRLEDRILFLHQRFSKSEIDRNASCWSALLKAIQVRNNLTHPKGATEITKREVEQAIQAIIDTLNAMFKALYSTTFPQASLGLQSRLTF